jgi:hypothetical protein
MHCFVFFFLNNILIYNKTWQAYVMHVDNSLQLLVNHQLFINRYKGGFSVSKVEYLGYIVSHDGLHVGSNKIEAMKGWPHPKILEILRGFPSLTSY